jgi:hypothetical protein
VSSVGEIQGGRAVPFRKPAARLNLSVPAARARAWLSPSPDYPDRFLMLLDAVILILKIRNGFVLGSFFGKSCIYNCLREYGAISFFVLIALSGHPAGWHGPCPPRIFLM